MRVLFMILCVLSLSFGSAFAEGENLTNNGGSFCEEGGKTPASISSTEEESQSSTGVVIE